MKTIYYHFCVLFLLEVLQTFLEWFVLFHQYFRFSLMYLHFWPYVIFSNNNKIPRTPNNYWLSSGSNTWEATIYLEFIFGITRVIFVKYIIGIACACTSFCPTKLNLKKTQYYFRLRWKGWEIMAMRLFKISMQIGKSYSKGYLKWKFER